MEFIISMVGADRALIGSDHRFDMGYEQPVGFVEELNLRAVQDDFGHDRRKLLKLNVTAATEPGRTRG